MDTKFSKGPWYVDDDAATVWAPHVQDGGDIVCEAPDSADAPQSRARWSANAALISAAPDMFEALAGLLDMLEGGAPLNTALARAALAKARGQ